MRQFDPHVCSILFIGLLWCGHFSPHGQSIADTIFSIPTVEVTATKIRWQTAGSTTRAWTHDQLAKWPTSNLAELLSTETGTYVKSYGQGSLATSSVRGGSAGHTLVLWNGLPIQNPMPGQLDLSLLPVQSVGSISFTRGGNATLWGSGAVSGVLNLDHRADFSKKINVKTTTQVGSFGQFQQSLKIGFGNHKIQSTTHLSHQQANNDFYHFLSDKLPRRQQTNARLSQQLLLQDISWKIDNFHQLSVHFWKQQSDRQIPPTDVQDQSEAHQDDRVSRLILMYKKMGNDGMWQVRMGFFDEHLNYFDDLISLASRSHFRTSLADIMKHWNWRKHHQFIVGSTQTYTRAWSASYGDKVPKEYKAALFASWKYQREKLNTQISLRQEMVDGDRVPIVPAFGFDFFIRPQFIVKGRISRNYRLPTFNDRFWLPGGNPNLRPESGWSQELTLTRKVEKNKYEMEVSLTAFNRRMDNWILWSALGEQSFWSANNVTKVWSRGLEPQGAVVYFFNDIKMQLKGGYHYIRSTNQVALKNPNMEVGDQLTYTPVHQTFGTLAVEWRSFYAAYQHTYTGTVEGVNTSLNSYQVGNIRVQYSGLINKIKNTFFIHINNIWNANYRVIEHRPMPGFQLQTGLCLSFR